MQWLSGLLGLFSLPTNVAQAVLNGISVVMFLATVSTIPLTCVYVKAKQEVQAKKKEIGSLRGALSQQQRDVDALKRAVADEMVSRKAQEIALGVCVEQSNKQRFTAKVELLACREGCEKRIRKESEDRLSRVRQMIKQFNPHTDDPHLTKKCPQKDPAALLDCLVRFILSDA